MIKSDDELYCGRMSDEIVTTGKWMSCYLYCERIQVAYLRRN